MFLRSTRRKKDGKVHRYFSVVENRRLAAGGTAQRTVLYLGEINDKQEESWRKSLTVFDQDHAQYTTMSLFPDDHAIPSRCQQWDSSAGRRNAIETPACIWELLVGV